MPVRGSEAQEDEQGGHGPVAPARAFRPDIDGLRAVAILAVVAYHVGLPGCSGGFAGVDVFFVISGYLITGNLLAEVDRTATVRLGSFWAGRVRRLVPALALMVGVTLVLALGVLGPLEWRRAATEGTASLLYVSNLLFAVRATNYFAASNTSSLFLHTWSLGVEEQFYLVWPVLLLALARLGRGRARRRAALLVAVLAATALGSFALAVLLTARGTPWSFFSLPTRAWEFALGGLAVCVTRAAVQRRPLIDAVLGTTGLVLIVAAVVRLSDTTPYPGIATAVPVLGALALIVAGERPARSVWYRSLASSPAQRLGRVSYSWYLWHWPLMLLGVALLGRDTAAVRGVGVVVALGVAVVTMRVVENPVRANRTLVARPARTFAVGAGITAVGLLVAGLVVVDADRKLAEPFSQRLAAASAGAADLDADAGCVARRDPAGIDYCVYGDPESDVRVLVAGDSHAAHWIPAFEAAAAELHIAVLVHSRGGCPSADVPVAKSVTRLVPSDSCAAFRHDTATLVGEFGPQAVVLANTDYLGRILDDRAGLPDPDRQRELWAEGLRTTVGGLQRDQRRVGLMLDNPVLASDPNVCMARTQQVAACVPSRTDALARSGPFNQSQVQALTGLPDVPTFDVTPTLCDPEQCALEHDGELVYQDEGHLAAGFVQRQGPAVAAFLRRLLCPGAPAAVCS